MQAKSIKSAAKEAKMRLKSRFWQDYKRDLDSSVKIAKEEGIGESGVKTYFKNRVVKNVRGTSAEEEAFYVKVKEMLDRCGCWTCLWTSGSFCPFLTRNANAICSDCRRGILSHVNGTTKKRA